MKLDEFFWTSTKFTRILTKFLRLFYEVWHKFLKFLRNLTEFSRKLTKILKAFTNFSQKFLELWRVFYENWRILTNIHEVYRRFKELWWSFHISRRRCFRNFGEISTKFNKMLIKFITNFLKDSKNLQLVKTIFTTMFSRVFVKK